MKARKENQSARIVGWVTPSEKKLVYRAAKKVGETPSQFTRTAAVERAYKVTS